MSAGYKTCPECNGTGIDDLDARVACWNCEGEGVVVRLEIHQQHTTAKIPIHRGQEDRKDGMRYEEY